MAATVNVNGRITGEREAVIPVFDHGFLYGEGVYETLRTYHGRPFLLDRHLRRLRASSAMIEMSAIKATASPAPTATPLIAETMTFSQFTIS